LVDTDKYNEWFVMAQKELRSAKILFDHDADNEIVCFHCQQTLAQNDPQVNDKFADADLIIKARIDRSEIQMLCKLVEGLGHLGIVTTTDKVLGEVMIQTTKHCWTELKKLLEQMPIEIEFI